ncbi:MAG: hypothetical protein Salg2KO_02050 [Salibacteraceae bacterium]
MKTHVLISAALITICAAFTPANDNGLEVTYGVSNSNPAQIELQLNTDYTFSYQDFSVPEKKVLVSGTYELKNNTVHLHAQDASVRYHNTWRIVDDGNAAKSRLGLAFYTLRKQ